MSVVAVTSALLAACGSTASESGDESTETLKIAVPAELSGPASAIGTEWVQYLELGVDTINEAGGIKSLGGRKLELLVKDTKSEPEAAPAIVREMKQRGALFTVGPVASASLVALRPTLVSLDLPWIGVAAEPALTAPGANGNMWRITGSVESQVETAFEFLKNQQEAGKIDVSTVGVFASVTPPAPDYAAEIETFAEMNGWKPITYKYDFTKTQDYSPIVAKMRDDNVDIVMGMTYPPDSLGLAKAIGLQSWRPEFGFLMLAGYENFNGFRAGAGPDVAGWLTSTPISGNSTCEGVNELSDKFEREYGVPISGSTGSAVAVVQLIADTLERAQSTDPEKIKEALASPELEFCDGMFGQLGGVSFDENGNNTAFVPQIVQLTGDLSQDVVWPEEAKVADVTWPAS